MPAVEPTTAGHLLRREPGAGKRIGGAIIIAAVFVFLYLPPIVMALFSVNDSAVQTLPFKGFTLTWYEHLFRNTEILTALGYSLRVSATAVIGALVIGTGFALLFWKPFRGSRVLQGMIAVPMLLPGMVLGVSLLLTFKLIGMPLGFWSIALAHTVFILPIVVFVVGQRLASFDTLLLQAAQDLGAGPVKAFFTVVFPLLAPALVAAALLGFTLSFDELAVTFFVAGFDPTLPVLVWAKLRIGFDPQINAIFTLLAVASVLAVLFSFRILAGDRKRARHT